MKKKLLFRIIGGVVAIGVMAAVSWIVIGPWQEPKTILRQITTAENEVKLTYSSYPKDAVYEVSSFEEENDIQWQGDGFYDNRNVFAGKTSLELASTDHEPSIAFTDKLPNMANLKSLEVGVNITDSADLESLMVYAGTAEVPQAYSYPITILFERWNIVRMDRDKFASSTSPESKTELPSWNEVNRLEFSLLSRPGATIIVNLDELRIENITDYITDWNVITPSFLGLAALNDQIFLSVRGAGSAVATIKEIPSATNFIYRAKIIPMSTKRTGLFFRGDYRNGNGYILWISGFDQNTWGLAARQGGTEAILDTGELTNILFRRGQPIWLEVNANGETVKASMSFDGEHWDTVAEATDSSLLHMTGGVGVFAEGGAISLFNDFYLTQ